PAREAREGVRQARALCRGGLSAGPRRLDGPSRREHGKAARAGRRRPRRRGGLPRVERQGLVEGRVLVEGVLERTGRPAGRSRLQRPRHAVGKSHRRRLREVAMSAFPSLVETAAAAAKAGGDVAVGSWRNLASGEISEKKKNDFVTDA